MEYHTTLIKTPLEQPIFESLKDGRKTVCALGYIPKFQNLKKDDIVYHHYMNQGKHQICKCRVTRVRRYPNIKALLKKEGVHRFMPILQSHQDALEVLKATYGKILEIKNAYGFGVIGFRIQLLEVDTNSTLPYPS